MLKKNEFFSPHTFFKKVSPRLTFLETRGEYIPHPGLTPFGVGEYDGWHNPYRADASKNIPYKQAEKNDFMKHW